MKLAKRSLAIILTLLLLCGLFPFGVFATSEELETDTGQEEIEEESPTNAESYTLDLAELVEEASSDGGEAEDTEADDSIGAIQLDDTTTIEFTEIDEATREEAFAEIMTEITDTATEENDAAAEDEAVAAEPDEELLESDTEAVLYLSLKDPGSAVCIRTDDGTEKTVNLYYLSDNDGQFYSLAPDDEAVEIPVVTDEAGRGIVPIQRGAAVHIEAIGGYGHVIAATSLVSVDDESITENGTHAYSFTMAEDLTLTVETEEVGVNIPDEDAVVGIQVMEKNGEFINDPTVTLPQELPKPGSGMMLKAISSNYWGTIEARYEGGGSHPYPNGNSTGVFTVWYNNKSYTGVCIDPSYGAPGSGYLNEWREWNYYNVPLKSNPTFFAAIASSYYSNYGSTSGTVAYINLRDRTNWDQIGAYMYSYCGWGNVVDNPSYGHGFAMYHELLGYLANGWSWDRSVLGSSGIKSHIVNTCNKIYDLINPSGADFWQYAYNVLYTYRVFYYQSTTAGKQRIAWTVPRTDYGTVTIKKVSSKTGEPLPNCTITLTDVNDPNHKFTATTGDDGIATFNWVTWTTYTVEETVPPDGYEISYVAEDVAFTASFTYMSIEDGPQAGTFEVVKLDHETATPLAGAVFQIKDEDGNVYAMATTPESGRITIEDIPYGDYTYQETTAPEGFELDPTVYTFTIEGGDTVTHTRENCRIPGSITVKKTDEDGNTLSGVTYLLRYSTDGGRTWKAVYSRTGDDVTTGGCTSAGLSNGKLTTGSGGIAKFEGLRADGVILYKLTETSTRNGKTLLTEPVYEGTLPVDGDSDPVYDISYTVADGTVFRLPATGSSGFAYMPLALICLTPAVTLIRRRRRA